MIINLDIVNGQHVDPNGKQCCAVLNALWDNDLRVDSSGFVDWFEANFPGKINLLDRTVEIEDSAYTMLVLKYL
jgi:hypothetical protein